MRFFEYDISTGQILSEIISATVPEVEDGVGVVEVNDYEAFDPSKYIIKNGVITKAYETKAEQLERERLRKEHREHCLLRVKSMMTEFFIASMKEDDEALADLRKEFSELETYL